MIRHQALNALYVIPLLIVLAPSVAHAQNHSLEGFGANNSHNGLIATFHAINDIVIRNVEVPASTPGDHDIEIWFNPLSNSATDPNWELKGMATVNFPEASEPELIPVDIDGLVAAGRTFGIAIVNQTGSIRYDDAPQAHISDDNLIIDGETGLAGPRDPSETPPIDPSFSGRIFSGVVHYDLKGQGFGPNNGHDGHIAQIEAETNITVRELSYTLNGSGELREVEVWFNPNSAEPEHSDWTYHGSAQMLLTGEMTRIPVAINETIEAGTTFGVAVVIIDGGIGLGIRYDNGPQPDKSDGNITFSGDAGWGGEHDPSATPPIDPEFSPRLFAGILHYDIAPHGDDPNGNGNGNGDGGCATASGNTNVSTMLLALLVLLSLGAVRRWLAT